MHQHHHHYFHRHYHHHHHHRHVIIITAHILFVSFIRAAHTGFTQKQIVDNIVTVVNAVVAALPEKVCCSDHGSLASFSGSFCEQLSSKRSSSPFVGFISLQSVSLELVQFLQLQSKNLQSVFIKTNSSLAVPIYASAPTIQPTVVKRKAQDDVDDVAGDTKVAHVKRAKKSGGDDAAAATVVCVHMIGIVVLFLVCSLILLRPLLSGHCQGNEAREEGGCEGCNSSNSRC